MRPFVVRLTLGYAVVVVAAVAVACWFETHFVFWLTNLAVLGILMVLTLGYDRPSRYLVRSPFRWVFPALGVVGVLSVVRFGSIRWPHVSSEALACAVVSFVILGCALAGLREPAHEEVSAPLTFPLQAGRWAVVAGGLAALNHHLVEPAQTGALDLVAVRRDGARAAGVCPRELMAYEAYGAEVVSPCDGVVAVAVDGEPDQLPQRLARCAPSGNHVRIDTGSEIVHLAHLRPGSVRVAVGDKVVAGQPLGEVGNSGRTTEPHLHVHAERDGHGLRLRFPQTTKGRLRPGVVFLASGEPADAN